MRNLLGRWLLFSSGCWETNQPTNSSIKMVSSFSLQSEDITMKWRKKNADESPPSMQCIYYYTFYWSSSLLFLIHLPMNAVGFSSWMLWMPVEWIKSSGLPFIRISFFPFTFNIEYNSNLNEIPNIIEYWNLKSCSAQCSLFPSDINPPVNNFLFAKQLKLLHKLTEIPT